MTGRAPTFLIIGAQKAATTSVYFGLKRHPQVFLSTPKELHFFSIDSVFAKGCDWYFSHFAEATGQPAVGEASTSYSALWRRPHTVSRIKQLLSSVQIMYVVRHPLRRIESHWMHQWRFGQVDTDFDATVRSNRTLIDCSLYWRQISAYREAFGDENIHIIFTEDFARDPAPVLRRAFEFVGADPMKLPATSGRNRVAAAGLSRIRNPSIGSSNPGEKRPVTERPTWNRSLLAEVLPELREDARRFLAFYGKPADYWPEL